MKPNYCRVFIIISSNWNLAEEKIREYSKNFSIFSFKKDNKELINSLLREINKRLFGSPNDIVLREIKNLKENEYENLVSLIKNSNLKFFLVDSEKNNFDLIKKYFEKYKVNYEEIDLTKIENNKFEIRKFIEEKIRKENIKIPKEFIGFLLENYGKDIGLLLQDLKNIKYYSSNNEVKLEEIINLFHTLTDEFKIQEAFLSEKFPNFVHYFKKYIYSLRSENYEIRKKKVEGILYNLLFGALLKIYQIKTEKNKKIEGHPFYIEKLKSFSKNLDNKKIKKMIKVLAQVDKKIKKYYLNYKELPEEISISYLLWQKQN